MTETPPHVWHRIAEAVTKKIPHCPVPITADVVETFLTGDIAVDPMARELAISLPFGVPAIIAREAREFGLEPAHGAEEL